MSLRFFGRGLLLAGGAGAAALVASYRNDLPQLQFDASTAAGSLLKLLDAESAHVFGVWAAKHGLVPHESRPDPPSLRTTVWGRDFPSPIGLAAGFDKDAEGVEGLLRMGFGFVEVGAPLAFTQICSVTPLPQPGNPKPRVFRLPELEAVINRYGFNSAGVDAVRTNLASFRAREGGAGPAAGAPGQPRGLVGVNLGKNKTSEDAGGDYALGVAKLGPLADYLVINISSPNTPGLRALQGRRALEALVKRVKATRDGIAWGVAGPPPLLVKVAPDLTERDKADIAAVALRQGVDGLVVCNTTLARPPTVADHPCGDQVGGLSGRPLAEMATGVLRDMYALTKGRLPIIGVGGVASAEDAYAKIRAGASLVQVYTGFAYEGPAMLPRLKRELAALLARDGYACLQDAVGADHRRNS